MSNYRELRILEKGESFGEAIMYDIKYLCKENCIFACLSKNYYKKILE